MDVFQKVALLLPEHRRTDPRRSQNNLDDLLDDYRKIGDFEAWGLDLLLMSYRLHSVFEKALQEFRPDGVHPPRLKDFLAMGFAARLTREHSRLLSHLANTSRPFPMHFFDSQTAKLIRGFNFGKLTRNFYCPQVFKRAG
jgi:hypothetical protein